MKPSQTPAEALQNQHQHQLQLRRDALRQEIQIARLAAEPAASRCMACEGRAARNAH